MKKTCTNYAFIDSQNINLQVRGAGWRIDWHRFRIFLKEKYGVEIAYLFIGFVHENQNLYRSLQRAGFILVFKEVSWREDGKPKGNVDAELVLQAMIDLKEYDRAVIATSDGDFSCLVRYLAKEKKLECVLSPNLKTCSVLLKKAARDRIAFLEDVRHRIEYKALKMKKHRAGTKP